MNVRTFHVLGLVIFALPIPLNAALQYDEGQAEAKDFGWSVKSASYEQKKRPPRRERTPTPITLAPSARTFERPSDPDEIRVETDLVLSDVLIFDRNGVPVFGLAAHDFSIVEDGVPQEVAVFSNGDRAIPKSIILVIDHSLSQLPYVKTSVEAAKVLIDAMRPGDRMAIVTDDVRLLSDYSSDKAALKKSLDELKSKALSGAFGASRQYTSLMAALKEKASRDATRQIVIFQTDGDESALLRADGGINSAPFTIDDIAETAISRGVTVYSVYTGVVLSGVEKREKMRRMEAAIVRSREMIDEVENKAEKKDGRKIMPSYVRAVAQQVERDAGSVELIAKRTGGLNQNLERPEQAFEIYDRILSDMERRYVIGYYPSNQSRDGRERRVEITVKGRPDCRVTGRNSYVAN